MINYSETKDKLSFTVRVVPRASRTEVVGEANGVLRIRLAAPPVDGAANEELVRVLARALRDFAKCGGNYCRSGSLNGSLSAVSPLTHCDPVLGRRLV